ncbi:MAG: nicotinate phosphoribosyltransferase [Peltula sp. TS41687]|nr:MAG: nicotinate phosphoribosyltransferase [Peltula sp. TS41687]
MLPGQICIDMASETDPGRNGHPEGVSSLLDTDLYKLTMQSAVLKYFPDVDVTYTFTNRTPQMKLTRAAYNWLEKQVQKLENISITPDELQFLRTNCPYLNQPYLNFLETFRLRPSEQIRVSFNVSFDTGNAEDVGDLHMEVTGLWVETILYEIPLLALTSEAYFRFCDRDWSYDGQESNAHDKALELLQHGCFFSEFGTRRRRDYHTQDLVIQGLVRAADEVQETDANGKLMGTSNVHFAMRHGIPPNGTVAHEWVMGVAAITNNYENANETALRYWVGCFGKGVLGIALTDTFGTASFLDAFRLPAPEFTSAAVGKAATLPSAGTLSDMSVTDNLSSTDPPLHHAPIQPERKRKAVSYAQIFKGVRQDSGDPAGFIQMMRKFYDAEGIKDTKTIVFSDSLNLALCLEYKRLAEEARFQPSFGVGTFLTNDFKRLSDGKKSVPLNIVIKLSMAGDRPAVKISDNIGKNTGDEKTVESVKRRLGYIEKAWEGGDETSRWKNGEINGLQTSKNGTRTPIEIDGRGSMET